MTSDLSSGKQADLEEEIDEKDAGLKKEIAEKKILEKGSIMSGTEEMAQYILKKIICAQLQISPLKAFDLTQTQATLLRNLFSAKESGVALKMSDLSEMMGSTKSATSQSVSKLERNGLIKRKWSKTDRRRVLVGLTPKGVSIAENFNKNMLEFIQSKLDKLKEDELEVFIKIFEKCME